MQQFLFSFFLYLSNTILTEIANDQDGKINYQTSQHSNPNKKNLKIAKSLTFIVFLPHVKPKALNVTNLYIVTFGYDVCTDETCANALEINTLSVSIISVNSVEKLICQFMLPIKCVNVQSIYLQYVILVLYE